MEWIEGMNQAVEYVENHLDEEINPKKLAKIATCSTFHFERMFAFIAGVTIHEYIRRRRMSAAAFDLMDKDTRVIDIALKYGYESPTAFNRAFKAIHGVAPSEAKKAGVPLNTFPKITFTLSVKGEKAMNYKIIKKEAFRVVGFRNTEPMTMEDCFEKMPRVWEDFYAKDGIKRLEALMHGKEPKGILALSLCENEKYAGCLIGVATDEPTPDEMVEYVVPETTYAIFEVYGAIPEAMQSVQERIISEWLPASGYEYAPAPDIEVYPAGERQAKTYYSEVWLPIIKSKNNL